MTRRRIIIVDDHPLFRAALRQTLAGGDATVHVEESGDLNALSKSLDADRDCDLVLLDLNMPGVRGFSGLLLVRAQYPDIPVMIISAVEDATVVRRAFELGASGYLHKSEGPTEIRRAIETVLAGEVFIPKGTTLTGEDEQSALMKRLAALTPQQVRVLMMLSDGLMNKQIAYELSISEATVKAHVSAILQKLDVDSRTQAVIAAARIEEGQFEALFATGAEKA
ncbi:response regulator transcription factor [Devosia sp. BK]|jgi:DNA-binding NarL/FixJ family response regulator|uniref:response regulator n=1 Tax=unclassified Devosia TaxID=196773 RepID=UPI000714E063|nr:MULTISPECIES: response regulator transcription factor [unclassified Devosia]KQN76835.1 LuxR family transcriptional regulator [Devosia sp. Leaf64]KQT49412.1 LuxR family transcriptional regulator [Devosia sp. Leaf420]MDV3251936.1 response regulator transcription factor [Devosia sp. BK]